MAEIVSGSIISIDKGQFEGTHSVGTSHFQTMFNVVLPQAIRHIMPSICNEFLVNIKDSSVLSVIAITEHCTICGSQSEPNAEIKITTEGVN